MTPTQDATALAVLKIFVDAMDANGNWDDGCFYYGGRSASELQRPIELAKAALRSTPSASAGPQAEAVAWRIRIREGSKTYHIYTERLPFEPDVDSKIVVLGEPVSVYLAQPQQADGRGAVIEALEFYADPTRYSGPNSRLEGEPDKYQPDGLYYRLDVTRDDGRIARRALSQSPETEGR